MYVHKLPSKVGMVIWNTSSDNFRGRLQLSSYHLKQIQLNLKNLKVTCNPGQNI